MFPEEGDPRDLFLPRPGSALDGSGRKTTALVRDLEYFIHTKFHQNPSSGSGEEVENVNSLTDDGRQTDDERQTDFGSCALKRKKTLKVGTKPASYV